MNNYCPEHDFFGFYLYKYCPEYDFFEYYYPTHQYDYSKYGGPYDATTTTES